MTRRWLGEKPTSDAFGGDEFTVAPGGHSSYFGQGSAGLRNMGKIIACKQPALVHPAPPTDPALGLSPPRFPADRTPVHTYEPDASR